MPDELNFGVKLTFIPNAEDVELISLHNIDLKGSKESDKFLTSLDELNRRHGYNKYIPDNLNSFRTYWSLAYGIDCAPTASTLQIAVVKNSYYTRVVPLQTLAM